MIALDVDVVERICKQARPSSGCPLPPRAILRAVVSYLVDKILHTKGETATISIMRLRHRWALRKFATQCVLYWLGIEDCLYLRLRSKLVFYRQCVIERLGLE